MTLLANTALVLLTGAFIFVVLIALHVLYDKARACLGRVSFACGLKPISMVFGALVLAAFITALLVTLNGGNLWQAFALPKLF
jgi:hypothetical protein